MTRIPPSRSGSGATPVQTPRDAAPSASTTAAEAPRATTPADRMEGARRTLPGTTRDGPGATAATPALPISRREMADWTQSVGAQATTTGAGRIQFGDTTLSIPAGTQLSTVASEHGLTIRANPPLPLRTELGPIPLNVDVASLRYDFRTARFSADIRGDIPGRLDDRILSHFGSKEATDALRPLLPSRMQQPGYSPRLDRDLQGTVRSALDRFATAGAPREGGGTAPALSDVTGWVTLRTGRDVNVDFQIPGRNPQDARFSIPRGTDVTVHGTLDGTVRTDAPPATADLRLRSASIDFGAGAHLQVGDNRLASARIDGVTLERGGRLVPRYDLTVEQEGRAALTGLQGLLAIAGMRTGSGELVQAAGAMGRPQDLRLDGVHRMIDDAVNEGARPALLELFSRNDRVIPGVSLMDLMGMR